MAFGYRVLLAAVAVGYLIATLQNGMGAGWNFMNNGSRANGGGGSSPPSTSNTNPNSYSGANAGLRASGGIGRLGENGHGVWRGGKGAVALSVDDEEVEHSHAEEEVEEEEEEEA